MKKGERTRSKMIDATAQLLQRQGYHATGVNQVLTLSDTPKGSLYFHFPGGKEELACAALEQSGEEWRARISEAVSQADSLAGAILATTELLADDLERSEFANGCPVATVALETSQSSEVVRTTCAAVYNAWTKMICQRAVSLGVARDLAESLADLVLSSIEGAMLLARVRQDATVIRTVGQQLAAIASQIR